jgi:tRNA-dihydrouridine synthase
VAAGAQLVSVHGRTRCQFYDGEADWLAVAAVKSAIAAPVIVNGDIASIDDARDALAHSGADGAMIGRAALGRPWLLGEIEAALAGRAVAPLTPDQRCEVAIEHYRGLLGLYGVSLGLRHARKHLVAYAEHALAGASVSSAAPIKAALPRSEDPRAVESLLCEAFARAGNHLPEALAAAA